VTEHRKEKIRVERDRFLEWLRQIDLQVNRNRFKKGWAGIET
jgi:hypothetical protein